jgi:hypothetical protein
MLKRTPFCLTAISILAVSFPMRALAQEGGPPNKATGQAAQSEDKSKAQAENDKLSETYHLQFTLSELEDNKVINTRQYSLDVCTPCQGQSGQVKNGTRVPVESKQGEFQYLDVGINISARLIDVKRGQTGVAVNVETSSFALDDQDKHDLHPLIRQIRIEASTLLQLDKPMVIGRADDPNSKRRFQLEMTATKL